MRVVIPVGALHIGGGCRVLANLANALTKAGCDTEVVIPKGAPIEYSLSCKVKTVPALECHNIPYGDIVLPNFFTTFQPAFEAWPKQCIRLSLGFEPYFVPDSLRSYALWTYQQGVPTISISNWLNEQIAKHTGQLGEVVNLGIDPRVFYPQNKNLSTGRKTILYIARDPNLGYEVKGFWDFAESMQRLKLLTNEFRVMMICPEAPMSLTEVPYQIFQPRTDKEMAALYRKADVFVSTSWNEGFALPPLEAMACGTPVITTDSGGVGDFCIHNISACVVHPRNTEEIASSIYSVMKKTNHWNDLRIGGLKMAAKFTHKRFEQNIVSVLNKIYQNRR